MNTPNDSLFDAARYGDEAQAQGALDAGANNHNDALEVAAEKGYTGIVEMLAPHATDHALAMEHAAEKGHADIVRMLMPHADEHNYAMELAAENGHTGIVRMLMPHATDHNDAMRLAAKKGHTGIVQMVASYIEQPLSWLNNPTIKEARLKVARAHHAADTLRQGEYYDYDGNVCAIGCSVPLDVAMEGGDSIREYDSRESGLGYAWLAVQEQLFEADRDEDGAPQAAADFALASLETLPIGIDTNRRAVYYLAWRNENPEASLEAKREKFLNP